MHAALKLVGERHIDHAVAFESALSAEGFRHNIKPVVRFAARPIAGMSFMQVGLVLDMQAFGRESRQQLCRNDILHAHCFAGLAIRRH